MQTGNTKDNMIYFAHRKLADADLYFMANRKDLPEETTFTFPVNRKFAELWNPVTGERYSLTGRKSKDGSTSVDLCMAPREAFFVVFTDKQETAGYEMVSADEPVGNDKRKLGGVF